MGEPCPHDLVTGALDHGRAFRCTGCGHRTDEVDRHGRLRPPRATRYQPRRWLTEHYRRAAARRIPAADATMTGPSR